MTMTYKEWINAGNSITDIVDEGLNQALLLRFGNRNLGFSDPERFKDIYRIDLQTFLPQYEELLRTQPGYGIYSKEKSIYDWAITDYRERQLKHKEGIKKTTEHLPDTQTRTPNITESSTDGGRVTTFDDVTDNRTKSGVESLTKTGGHKETNVEGIHHDDSETVEGYHKITENYTQGLHTQTYSPHVQKKTKQEGGDKAWAGDSSIQKDLPSDIEYSDFIEPTNGNDPTTGKPLKEYYEKAYQHMPALEWSTATSQAQTGHREYHDNDSETTESYVYGDNVKGDITKNEGDKNSPDTTVTMKEGKADSPDTVKKTRQGEKENPDIKEFSYDEDGEVEKRQYGEGAEPITDKNVKSGRIIETGGTVTTGSDEITTNYGNIVVTPDGEDVDREIYTGRTQGELAKLLMDAQTFIRSSNAFKWLWRQLDPCFSSEYNY